MTKKFGHLLTVATVLLALCAYQLQSDPENQEVRILLMGDSTTEGGKPVFENSIEQMIAGVEGMPTVEVINAGKGGETAYSLLNSGRYQSQVQGIENVDYIFFRYGINDWFKRQPFDEYFPADMKKVIAQLREDFPKAQIIIMTIIPFLKEVDSRIVNESIAKIAANEKLELFDIYPAYQRKLEELGRHSMNNRFVALSAIPEEYHLLVEPFTKYYEWKKADWVRLQTNELDPLLGDVPDWYKDKHPNTTGYRFIAHETVKFLLPKLRGSLN